MERERGIDKGSNALPFSHTGRTMCIHTLPQSATEKMGRAWMEMIEKQAKRSRLVSVSLCLPLAAAHRALVPLLWATEGSSRYAEDLSATPCVSVNRSWYDTSAPLFFALLRSQVRCPVLTARFEAVLCVVFCLCSINGIFMWKQKSEDRADLPHRYCPSHSWSARGARSPLKNLEANERPKHGMIGREGF